MRKHNWIEYGNSAEIIEITIKDFTGRKLDFFRCNNNKSYKSIIKIIKKYGFTAK